MPYRHAHWWILALFPFIGVAFWPGYLGRFGASSFALHAHGLTAGTWLLLLAVQSWSAHARLGWHRVAGLATFGVLPLFAMAGPLALWSMIELHVAQADPFHTAYGARLALADMIAGPTVIALAIYAFVQRRRPRAHAAAMLATAITVLPPVLGRLTGFIPGFPRDGAWGMTGFELSFQLAGAVALLLAVVLARPPAARPAFAFAALATAAQMVGFATVAPTAAWERLTVGLLVLPVGAVAPAAGIGTLSLLWWAWRRVPPRGRATAGVAVAA